MKTLYIIGSLRNAEIPNIANELRNIGIEEFSDWYAAGPTADDCWRDYEKGRGKTYAEALGGYAAKHVFEFDKHHLDRCDAALLVYPAGKSAHLELGYVAGKGKPTFVLLDNPERWDVMLQFATKVFMDEEEMLSYFKGEYAKDKPVFVERPSVRDRTHYPPVNRYPLFSDDPSWVHSSGYNTIRVVDE